MILDKAFHGILDQGAGCLIVFDEPEEDVSDGSWQPIMMHLETNAHVIQKTYEGAIDTLKQMDKVVSSLYQKVCICVLL